MFLQSQTKYTLDFFNRSAIFLYIKSGNVVFLLLEDGGKGWNEFQTHSLEHITPGSKHLSYRWGIKSGNIVVQKNFYKTFIFLVQRTKKIVCLFFWSKILSV